MPHNRSRLARLSWTAALLYAALLTYLLLVPHPLWFLGGTGEQAEEAVDQTLADYVQHALAYSLLGLSLVFATAVSQRPRIMLFLILAALHGVLCEILQHFIPHRYFGANDALANVIGVVAGGLLALVLANVLHGRAQT